MRLRPQYHGTLHRVIAFQQVSHRSQDIKVRQKRAKERNLKNPSSFFLGTPQLQGSQKLWKEEGRRRSEELQHQKYRNRQFVFSLAATWLSSILFLALPSFHYIFIAQDLHIMPSLPSVPADWNLQQTSVVHSSVAGEKEKEEEKKKIK